MLQFQFNDRVALSSCNRPFISVNTAQAVNITTLLTAINANKNFSANFNGAQLTANNLQQAVAAAGTNTSISANTAQAVNIDTLLSVIKTNKRFSADFNGAQLTANNLQQAIAAAGTNTSISVNTAQAVNIDTLLSVIRSNKRFSANFNGAQLTANNLQQAVAAAGTNTSISVNTAQSVNIETLLSIMGTAGSTKKFSASFDGEFLNTTNLKRAVSAAGSNTSVTVNDAQKVSISTLLSIVNTAG